MGQNLIKAVSTYFQFLDKVFGLLSLINKIFKIPIMISIRKNSLLSLYIDNYLSSANIFENIF